MISPFPGRLIIFIYPPPAEDMPMVTCPVDRVWVVMVGSEGEITCPLRSKVLKVNTIRNRVFFIIV